MTRETLIILVKAVLTAVGSFLIGTQVFGQVIDLISWEAIGGIILSGISIYWSIADKEYTIEKGQAFMRQVLLFLGGFLTASGVLTDKQLESILAAIPILIAVLQSYFSKKKAQKIKDGEIQTYNLASIPKK